MRGYVEQANITRVGKLPNGREVTVQPAMSSDGAILLVQKTQVAGAGYSGQGEPYMVLFDRQKYFFAREDALTGNFVYRVQHQAVDTNEGRERIDTPATCPGPTGCDSCPDPEHCSAERKKAGLPTNEFQRGLSESAVKNRGIGAARYTVSNWPLGGDHASN